jgi:hypothetical protein
MRLQQIYVLPGAVVAAFLIWLALAPVVSADEPALTSEIAWFVNKPRSYISFVAFIQNHSDQSREGVQVNWDALDAAGNEVRTQTATLPIIAARSTYAYLSGDGRGNINQPEPPVMRAASVRLTIVDEGAPTEAQPHILPSYNVTLDKSPLPRDPILDQGFLGYRVQAVWNAGSEPLPWKCVRETVLLQDEQGNIVGAKDWRYFADSSTQADGTYKLHVFFNTIDAIAPSASAVVRVECLSI